ncbi:MAG: hypothetical protein EA417_20425 [Gammaproteobacteria bacterium]|nr:MAG: hypothetical protein EA417_20425 [Gammaproteobacteria bacterium]
MIDTRPVRLASLGPLFVIPELRARAAGAQLLKRTMAGAQELSASDGASEDIRRLWERLGGTMAVTQSIEWTIALAPARLLFEEMASHHRVLVRAPAKALKLVAPLGDRMLARRWQPMLHRPAGSHAETQPLTTERFLELSEELSSGAAFRVVYAHEVAEWIFEQLTAFSCRGELLAREVLLRGKPIGAYIAYHTPAGKVMTMNIQARPADMHKVLGMLLQEAKSRNALAVTGRLEGNLPAALMPYRAHYRYGTRVLIDSRHREILHAISALDTNLSRIDGEWLMDLRNQPYA